MGSGVVAQEKELKYRREALGKWKLELIHRLMDALDLPRGSGDKVWCEPATLSQFLHLHPSISGWPVWEAGWLL
jgi:hypothetical protein